MTTSSKISAYLSEERINVKKMSVEELAKMYLAKANGNDGKAYKMVSGYMDVVGANDPRHEKLKQVLAALKTPTKTTYSYGGPTTKKDGVNPTLEKMKVEYEKEKKANAAMTFAQLPEKFKKLAAREGAGENSVITHAGTDWKKSLGKNPLYIKTKNGNYFVTPSFSDGEYQIHDENGQRLSWKDHRYERPMKRNGFKSRSWDFDNSNFKKSNMLGMFSDVSDVFAVEPDKIRKDLDAERHAQREANNRKNPNADISGAVIDKYIGKANADVEASLVKRLSDIISKTGKNGFDPKELDSIKNDLYELHRAKMSAADAKTSRLYDPASYGYDEKKKRPDTSTLSTYGRGSRLTWTGKDVLGRINKILGKGKTE